MDKRISRKAIQTRSKSSKPRGNRSSSNNQKKSKSSLKTFFLTEYMKQIILPEGDDFRCNICVDKPQMKRKNVFRHITESITHSNSVAKQSDIDGHKELIPKILEELAKNKKRYRKKNLTTKEDKKDYLRFLVFCQKQNFSFQQISSLGKFIHEMTTEKRLSFF